MKVQREIFLPLSLVERRGGFAGDLAGYARTLVRVVVEKGKPNAQRLREYSEAALPSLEESLFASTPVYKDMDEVLLGDSLATLKAKLPGDPATQEALKGRAPADAARELVAGSRLDDPAVRRQLYAGGAAAVAASTDPMIVLMRAIDTDARKYRTQYDDQVASPERIAGGKIGRLRAEPDDGLQLCVNRRHHRRQLGLAGGEQGGRSRRHHLRQQHAVAAVAIRVRRCGGTGRQRGFARHPGSAAQHLSREPSG